MSDIDKLVQAIDRLISFETYKAKQPSPEDCDCLKFRNLRINPFTHDPKCVNHSYHYFRKWEEKVAREKLEKVMGNRDEF